MARRVAVAMMAVLVGCLADRPQQTRSANRDGGTGGGDSTGPGTLLCEATLALSGSFTPGNAAPTDFPGGCWPDGTWTFQATVTQNGCATPPRLETQYSFQAVEDTDYNDKITYLNDPNNQYVPAQISGGEGGICVGAFLIFSADGKTLVNLRPALQTGNVIDGKGDYRVFDTDQR